MASLALTYLLWIIGGVFGLHHLYLGRVNQAFVWFATLGGVFGLGWFRDLWRIPFYVKCRNGDKEWQELHLTYRAVKRKPTCGVIRSLGMFAMGYLASVVLCGLLPGYKNSEAEMSAAAFILYRVCSVILIVAGSSVGVWVVANIGEFQCQLKYPLIGALVATPWLIVNASNASVPTVFASLGAWWFGVQWRPLDLKSPPRRGLVNVLVFLTCISLWSAVFCFGIYYHAEITVNNGEKIPLRVAMRNFFASPAWHRLKDSCYRLYVALRTDGWQSAYTDAVDVFDFSGEANALELLGLDKSASQEVITKKCRKLSSLHHPDRQKTPAAKAEAEAKFLSIREACSVLTRKPYQRSRYN